MQAFDVMNVPVPNHWKVSQEGHDFMPLLDWFPNPIRRNAELTGGFAGHGLLWEEIPQLWPAVAFALLWFAARAVSKAYVFPPLARAWGVRGAKKQQKFSYNMWLLTFYASSVAFGWFYGLAGEPYFAFPVDKDSGATMWNYHPAPIKPQTHWYYLYQLGFYIAELYAIFVEARRSDFLEYVLHHIVTIVLIAVSYVAHEQRVGALIIFIHDVPDVFLCVTKLFLYTGFDNVSSVFFVAFAAVFAFLRLYCFPMITYTIFNLAPQFHPASYAYWFLAVLLGVVLQGLQVFWFAMILRLIIMIIVRRGDHDGDPRSDEESDGDASKKDKKKASGKPRARASAKAK